MMPARRYDTPGRKVGRPFVQVLREKLRRACTRRWNMDKFTVFQTATLLHVPHVTASHAIRWRIGKCLDTWEDGQNQMLVKETDHTCNQYLSKARRDNSEEHRAKTFHSLVLRGKLRTVLQWITERKEGGVMQTGDA